MDVVDEVDMQYFINFLLVTAYRFQIESLGLLTNYLMFKADKLMLRYTQSFLGISLGDYANTSKFKHRKLIGSFFL